MYLIFRYFRKGSALAYLGRYDESIKAYIEGLKHDPNNEQVKASLDEIFSKEAFQNV